MIYITIVSDDEITGEIEGDLEYAIEVTLEEHGLEAEKINFK